MPSPTTTYTQGQGQVPVWPPPDRPKLAVTESLAVPVPDARSGRSAELAKLVWVVAQRVVPVPQRVDGAACPEKLDGRLDVVVAVHNVHHVTTDQPVYIMKARIQFMVY